MEPNPAGGNERDASPRRKSAEDVFGNSETYVGLCEFDKELIHKTDTLLVNVRGIVWFVGTGDEAKVEEDESDLWLILKDDFPPFELVNIPSRMVGLISERIRAFLERVQPRELASLQFRVVTRKKATDVGPDVRNN